MEYIEFKTIFEKECKNNNIIINENVECFFKFMKLLLSWNEKINLTAIKDEKEFIVKHFVDSLVISRFVDNNKKIIDVGTGGGFPGMPLKLYNDSLNVTLIDSVNKKISVLNDIIEKMNLKNIEALHMRAEDLAKKEDYREMFDIATSRAVSNMSTLVEYLIPFVKVGGYIYCMKGPEYDEELKQSMNAIKRLGGELEKIEKILINNEFERNIIIIRKVKNTDLKYPRSNGKPLREPIV